MCNTSVFIVFVILLQSLDTLHKIFIEVTATKSSFNNVDSVNILKYSC